MAFQTGGIIAETKPFQAGGEVEGPFQPESTGAAHVTAVVEDWRRRGKGGFKGLPKPPSEDAFGNLRYTLGGPFTEAGKRQTEGVRPQEDKGRVWTDVELEDAKTLIRQFPDQFTTKEKTSLERATAAAHPFKALPDQIKTVITKGISQPFGWGEFIAPGLKEELKQQLDAIPGIVGPTAAATTAEGIDTFIKLKFVFPFLFKAAGLPLKLAPVKKAASVLKKATGLNKLADLGPTGARIERLVSTSFGAAIKGAEVGALYTGVTAYTEGMSLEDAKPLIMKNAALMAGMATAFNVAGFVDTQVYRTRLKSALLKANNAKYRKLHAELQTLPDYVVKDGKRLLNTAKGKAIKGAASSKRLDLHRIDKIVAEAEATLIGAKKGKLIPGQRAYVESPIKAAQRFMAEPAGAQITVRGAPRLETGMGIRPQRDILTGEAVRPGRGAPVPIQPAAAAPVAKPPAKAAIVPPTAEGKGWKKLIPVGAKGQYFNLNEETGKVAFLVPFTAEPGQKVDPRYQATPVNATVADLQHHFTKLDKPIQKAFRKWADIFAKENPDKLNELINQPLTEEFLQPSERTAPPTAEGKGAKEPIDTAKFERQARIEEAMTKGEMGEIELEPGPELGSQSPAFNKHIDYFMGKQLPKTSKIRTVQKKIRQINGKRLAGKITPQQANKRIANLRKLLMRVAQREGVSVRMTKGGKVMVAVRKAGTYAPEEFSRSNFKDVYPLGQDVTRSVQQIDGALTVKQKMKTKGQAGAAERYILWPTRDMSIQKDDYRKEKTALLKKTLRVKKGSEEDAQINLILEQIAGADRSKSVKDVIKSTGATPSVVKQAMDLRKFYDDVIEEQNQARKLRDQEPIPYRRNYSPHILRDTTIWERMMFSRLSTEKVHEAVFGKKSPLPDYIKPNKPFNPRELAREGNMPYEERVKSATELAQNYLVTAMKDIFNTSIIQNNKAFIQQLEAMGKKDAANYLADWTAEAYAGIKPSLDRGIKLTHLPKTQKAMRWFNKVRNLAVFPFNFSWSLLTQTSSLALTVGRYGTGNTVRGFKQWLNPKVREKTAKNYYSYIIKSAKQGKMSRQDAQNLIGESVQIRKTKGEAVSDVSTYFLEQMEKLLTGVSIRAAHLHGSKRGLTGEALKNYASDGGAKTQSMYNDEDKPAILRSLAVKTAAPYQTFAYEVMNTLREYLGKTGTPPDSKLYAVWSILRFLAAAAVFASIAKKAAGKDVWSWKRPPIPFAEFWLTPILRIFNKEYMGGSASGLTSPVGTATKMAKGIDDVLAENNWRKLRNELIKYGPGVFGVPGGVQWSRTVDAIIAYSQGGVRDRRGRMLFKMDDPQDLIQAMFSGVWSTEGGQEYLDRRSGKKTETAIFVKEP